MSRFHRSTSRQTEDSKPSWIDRLLHRSRSSSPAPNRTGIDIGEDETIRPGSWSGAGEEPCVSKGDTCDAKTVNHLDCGGDSLDLPRDPYEEALSSLGQDERETLMKGEAITCKRLFQSLDQADQAHMQESLFRKGLKAATPFLQRLNITIDFISPFVAEPGAAAALGLIKNITSIAIAICGAADDMINYIQTFLERIPAIDRCCDAVKDTRSKQLMPDIYHALVNVYKDLLQFYLKAVALFAEQKFILRVGLSILRQDLPEIISSFHAHTDLLSTLLESENFASIQDIKNEQVDTLIRDTLDREREHEAAYHNELERRADEACSWITSNEAFSHWMLNSRGSNLLALLGDMGCGKTMTSAYVMENLSKQQRLVCAYYCKDDNMSTDLGRIYRSLLWQLLNWKPDPKSRSWKPDFKGRFWKWYKETDSKVPPTQSCDKLREFLYEAISSSKEWIFIVLDGLDECDAHTRKQLLSLFQRLFEKNARVKVFVSSRYDDDIEAALLHGTTRIEPGTSKERDRMIAAYLISDQDSLPWELRKKAVNELAARAEGSAIWIRIAVEFIGKHRIQNDIGLDEALEHLPSSDALAELYWKLFDKTCLGMAQNRERLQRALETLAIAQRPLTLEELAHAVFLNSEDGKITTLPELEKHAHSVDLLGFARPFVSVTKAGDGPCKNPQLRLVHQSLKELILEAPPSSWCSKEKLSRRQQNVERTMELHGHLLRGCVKYLLFEECGGASLLSSFRIDPGLAEFLAIGNLVGDDGDQGPTAIASTGSEPSQDFDPFESGFGRFFAYAAEFWLCHLSSASPDRRPDSLDVVDLCKKDSRRLMNWVEQWRRPNCSYIAEYDFPEPMSNLDPLVITAIFGPVSSLNDLLGLDLHGVSLVKDSAQIAIKHLVARGSTSAIKSILEHKDLRSSLCGTEVFYEAVRRWSEPAGRDNMSRDWGGLFDFLIRELRDDLLEGGNYVLCHAASRGCLMLIEKLFVAADRDANLRRAILAWHQEPRNWFNSSYFHGCIGEAVYRGHVDVVRFLCQQTGIEPHLRYISKDGYTVFHLAAYRGTAEVYQILLEQWPEGVHLRNKDRDTPLGLRIFRSPQGEDQYTVDLVRLLIGVGKVDATGRDDRAGDTPLSNAILRDNTTLMRVLIIEGTAEVYSEVGIENGKPFLTQFAKLEGQEKVLKELCSLLPLAVSVEYLF